MINGYSQPASTFPGSELLLYISTDAPKFRTEFYRLGELFEGPLANTNQDINDGVFTPDSDCASDWGWTPFAFTIPWDWTTGVYIAMFIEVDQNDEDIPGQPIDFSTADSNERKAMFIVRAPVNAKSSILFKVPTATNQAYNYVGGGSTYRDGIQYNGQGLSCSLLRPGNGTGGYTTFAAQGTPYYQLDVYDTSSDRMKIVHLEERFIRWLESSGYGGLVDYCSDYDLHFDPDLLSGYGLLLSVGHDEYWSENMRNNVVAFTQQGGNVAFFSGNTCYKHITFRNDWLFTNDGTWRNIAGVPSEDSFTGVSYYHANGRWDNQRQVVGYTLQHRDHWILQNVQKNIIGAMYENGEPAGLIGYECDGALAELENGVVVASSEGGTPDNFLILGYAELDGSWEDGPPDLDTQNMATMGVYTNPGTMVTVGTVDWVRVLESGQEKDVEQITRNILNRLGCSPSGLAALANIGDIICCDGFYSDDDNYRHAITGNSDGVISEIFYNPDAGEGQTELTQQDGLVDLGAFYTDDDEFRHVITAADDGTITEIFYNPEEGLGNAELSNIANPLRVCGFYTPDDQFRHAIVADDSGNVYEIFYGTPGQGQTVLGNFENVMDIGGFFSHDDNYRHVLVGTADGNITEIFYSPNAGLGLAVIANIPGLIRLTAYYAADDVFFNRRVQVLTQDGSIYEIRYHPDFGIIKTVLLSSEGTVDIGGFFSPDDGFRHCILGLDDGSVQELFFNP